MVQGYYTLDDAAKILGMSTEALSQMAQKREVRGFTDRGTWRFRTQDIDELARRKGIGSNPDLQLGEATQPPTKKSDTPVRQPAGSDPNVFNFPLGADSDQVEIGQEIIADTPSGSRKVPSKGGSKAQGPKSPPPKPGSDSDVRLVADGSDVTLQVAADSDVRVSEPPSASRSGLRKKTPAKEDSGVRLVPMESESDSDVKIVPDSKDKIDVIGGKPAKSGTDSDIRLEEHKDTRSAEDSFLTEEIDLD